MSALTDKEYYHLNISVSKALNLMEAPLKIKHARSVIITTHRTKESKIFWAVVSRQPLMENRFTAWKFCHLLHKVLREGHSSALKQSQCHKKMLIEMGKLWGHLHDGVGTCIQAYSKLLVTKLDFHEKNLFMTGSLSVPFSDIEKTASDDLNVYFQLGVEVFDYLDDIISLQETVFHSVDTYRMSSMTPQGQCRLAPMITLIQDSNPLYDLCVRIMFKLHDNLPADVLIGHRDRFREIFLKLKLFYDKVRPLQYFADLIQVPFLPDIAPNFTSKVDFGNYIPPIVTVPEPEPEIEPILENLVDLSISDKTYSGENLPGTKESEIFYEQKIQALNRELHELKDRCSTVEDDNRQVISNLQEEVKQLHSELKLTCLRFQKEKGDLKAQISKTTSFIQKVSDIEEKANISEEKFVKLKKMYGEMRDEHINLLRQSGETTKLLNREKSSCDELKSKTASLEKEIFDLREKSEVSTIEKTAMQDLLEEKTLESVLLLKELEDLKKQIEVCRTSESLITIDIKNTKSELEEMTKNFESTKALGSELSCELAESKKILNDNIKQYENSIAQIKSKLQDNEMYIKKLKDAHFVEINRATTECQEISSKLSSMTAILEKKNSLCEDFSNKIILAENNIKELNQRIEILKNERDEANVAKQQIISDKSTNDLLNKNAIHAMLNNIYKTSQNIVSSNFNQMEQQYFERSFILLEKLQQLLDELILAYRVFDADVSNEKIVQIVLLLCNNVTILREVCFNIYSTTNDIEKGQIVFDKITNLANPFEKLFANIASAANCEDVESVVGLIKTTLKDLERLLQELNNLLSCNLDLGDVIESEIADMEKVITEAANKFVELLSLAKSNDNGIRLEVNGKILDACTILMESIKMLIKKSKILQEEIVFTGRGKATVKEFYKRNSEWTEGLISASKSVAKGANFLVEAANKAVTGESNQNFEIIVAAQEIAACTAQLVISSKVKSPKESTKLLDLTKASRMVSQATGAVVAIVKDCNERLENYNDVDLTKLTTSQAKTMEIDIHVKVLELEQALQMERLKLSAFRKNLYQNTEN